MPLLVLMKQILMLSDKIPTHNVGNVDSTMEKNAQHMVQDARNVSSTIIGSKCATVTRHTAGKPGHHPNRNLMAGKACQREAEQGTYGRRNKF